MKPLAYPWPCTPKSHPPPQAHSPHIPGTSKVITLLWTFTLLFPCGLRSTMASAVKAVTHGNRNPRQEPHDAGFHDREGFTTFFDIKLFAIMKSGRERGAGGIQGTDTFPCATPGRRLPRRLFPWEGSEPPRRLDG